MEYYHTQGDFLYYREWREGTLHLYKVDAKSGCIVDEIIL